ncbi:MAG: Branched-chain amino acid transport system 2 carrier protein [Chlamydiae bacterium]|nr:Branched-chain amino acid transport system 2 carrier protein [Chlamydiota bacterium]
MQNGGNVKFPKSGVIAAGLALFSMFFGAGDLIWPLILGGKSGDQNFYAMIGLLISGVSLPMLGLMGMMLFRGDYWAFFGQTGRIPGIVLVFLVQAILGPFGSIPRLMTLAHATLEPYLPTFFTLPVFSIAACVLIFLFTVKPKKIVDIMGVFLSPILILALSVILIIGFWNPPAPEVVEITHKTSFFHGLNTGYNTLDLIASFIFAPLVLSYFSREKGALDTPDSRRQIFKKMVKACALAGLLLAGMFVGLTYLASFYTPVLPTHNPEARLAAISRYILGREGAFFSCIAVSLSCLTTAIPISVISAEYIQKQFFRGKGNLHIAVAISLGLSTAVANLGFMGIASMLSPILQILCPGLILLSILNILHKLYEMPMRRTPVFAAFALSLFGYLIH